MFMPHYAINKSLKGHFHIKKFKIITLNDVLGQTKVHQHFLNFYNHPSHCYDFSKEGAHDVKWGQLISIY
jgi:hypothetical protein